MSNADTLGTLDSLAGKTGGILQWFTAPDEEARQYLTKQLKENGKITVEDKEVAYAISSSRKTIREIKNMHRVLDFAKQMADDNFESSSIDDDWLHFFFDRAKCVSNEQMQLMWAKILAGEHKKQGAASKQLIHAMSLIEVDTAIAFKNLCMYNMLVVLDEKISSEWRPLYSIPPKMCYSRNPVLENDLIALQNLGLIMQSDTIPSCFAGLIYHQDFRIVIPQEIIERFRSQPIMEPYTGNIRYTPTGHQLRELIEGERLDHTSITEYAIAFLQFHS